jgi:acetyltransferase-like isoleucine patch superfamily enzyme
MSYFNFLFFNFLDFQPPPIRRLFFRIILKKFGKKSYIDYRSEIRYPWKVSIGDYVEINRSFLVLPSLKYRWAKVLIGDGVVIAPNVTLLGAGQDPNNIKLDVAGDIIIRNNVYIGANSTIRFGVEIGEGAVIAAGAVVVHDVQSFSLVGGIPARLIRRL